MTTCRQLLTAYLGCGIMLLTATAGLAQSRATMEQERNRMVDEEIVAAGVKNPRVIEAMRDTPRPRVRAAGAAEESLLRHGPADRRRADHLAAVHRGLHDRADRSPARRQRAGDRHRQRLPGGRAGETGPRGLYDRDRREAGAPGGRTS